VKDPGISEESQRQALEQEDKLHLEKLARNSTREMQDDRQSEVEAKDEDGGGEREARSDERLYREEQRASRIPTSPPSCVYTCGFYLRLPPRCLNKPSSLHDEIA
jgi:hypothetical protein